MLVVGIGSYGVNEKDKYSYSGSDDSGFDFYDIIFDVTIVILVVGLVLFLISFAGCVGALRENTLMLNVVSLYVLTTVHVSLHYDWSWCLILKSLSFAFQFALVVGTVFLFEVVVAVLGFAFKDEIVKEFEKVLKEEGIEKYRDDPDWHDLVNWIQEEVTEYTFMIHLLAWLNYRVTNFINGFVLWDSYLYMYF